MKKKNEISINECHHSKDNLIISKKDQDGISLKKAKELFNLVGKKMKERYPSI